ncbi:MAG: twin-arginine translocation pathway signal, partial [Pseudomonadota bacterium]
MTYSRRTFSFGLLAGGAALAGCANGIGNNNDRKIDARVDQTLNFMFSRYPGTVTLADKSSGLLVMPVVTEAGFGLGGSFGRGALRVDDITVDYYSAASASVGPQIGAQQFAHVLFFMTENALLDFRRSPGWAAGADIEYAIQDR